MKNITPYKDINNLLLEISKNVKDILGEDLIGIYLFGSLTYGDFNLGSSDIDLVTVVKKPVKLNQLEQIKCLHKKTGEDYPEWRDRLECSYTPVEMLRYILPPDEPRPYFGGGIFYNEAHYGNEWIINNYLLYEYGIPLIGLDFKELIKPIDIIEVQKACVRDLFKEWEPKITDFKWLDNSHYQSYLVVNLCRILYAVMCGKTGTKKTSAKWAKQKFGLPWSNLIATALNWEYGKKFPFRSETIDFINFVIAKIKQTTLYHEMYSSNIHSISDILHRVIAWARKNHDIVGLALVGSYARNTARKDSDIDLVILTKEMKKYIPSSEWFDQFGKVEKARRADYGALTSWHVNYKNGHEVEFGIASPNWARIPPDSGTLEVIKDGVVILYDPKCLFKELALLISPISDQLK